MLLSLQATFPAKSYHGRAEPEMCYAWPYFCRTLIGGKPRISRMSGPGEITRLLAEWSGGNQAALDNLLPVVYDELRRVASNYMQGERPGHLLQTTALVHEAYLRLVDQQNVNYRSRTQFFAIAAKIMRHILVDYARTRDRAKRGDGV